MRSKIEQAGLDWQVDSAGTGAHQPGCAPHHLSQKVSRLNNIDISGQKCRQFRQEDLDYFDKIYVMDDENYFDVKQIAGKKWDARKVDFLLNEVYTGENRIIFDPWFGGEDGFHKVYKMIEKACEAIIKKYATAIA